ncbi:MAG: hypothetical protein ACI9HK_006184, partial [Pirellulaceae bacterium]
KSLYCGFESRPAQSRNEPERRNVPPLQLGDDA